jgi:hypothetical protein
VNPADSYIASKEIAFRELKGEFLVFSGLTRQTLVVEEVAFKMVKLLTLKPSTGDEILAQLLTFEKDYDQEELVSFVSASLEQFVDIGVLDCSQTK